MIKTSFLGIQKNSILDNFLRTKDVKSVIPFYGVLSGDKFILSDYYLNTSNKIFYFYLLIGIYNNEVGTIYPLLIYNSKSYTVNTLLNSDTAITIPQNRYYEFKPNIPIMSFSFTGSWSGVIGTELHLTGYKIITN